MGFHIFLLQRFVGFFQKGGDIEVLRAFFDACPAGNARRRGGLGFRFFRETGVGFLRVLGEAVDVFHIIRAENARDLDTLGTRQAVAAARAVELVEAL